MGFVKRNFITLITGSIFSLIWILIWPLANARADVSGFEHLRDISIDCGRVKPEQIKPRMLKKHFICSYEHQLCKVLNNGELQFEAYISVDCEVKSESEACPAIDVCAKPKQLSKAIVEEVRQMNDPNFTGKPDGALAPRPDFEKTNDGGKEK
jgi:hypothetical protein